MKAKCFFCAACRFFKRLAGRVIKLIMYYPRAMSVMSTKKSSDRILYIDASCAYFSDGKGGIPRVVKKFCECIDKLNVRHELVYTVAYNGFFCCKDKSRVRFSPNDVFFCPDFDLQMTCNRLFLKNMMNNGVRVYFFLYDLIPMHFPQFFDHLALYKKYFNLMFLGTGIITDSKTVLLDAKTYMQKLPKRSVNSRILFDYAYLGSDFEPVNLKQKSANESLEFLMVSTVEPRKKYDQALQAFEILWKKGLDVNLRIVGRPGWKKLDVFNLLDNHPELNKRLFWYKNGISDHELANLYKQCDAVIFASLEEGYGLAVVEAARYNKPVILRDIPIFREIAGDSAYYFCGMDGKNLSDAVEIFIECKKNGEVKLPVVKSNSWQEFTSKVLDMIWRGKTIGEET